MEEHGQGSSSGGPVVAACLGPPVKEADLMKTIGEKLRGFVKGSFLAGDDGRFRLIPTEEQHDTMALALSRSEGPGDGGEKPIQNALIGFESYSIGHRGDRNKAFYGHGDLFFWSAMFTAVMAVRLRARSICRVLGVEDVDEAVKRLCDVPCRSQLVIVAHPHGLTKTGPSAGLAAALSVVVMMTGRRLKRLTASTGEITLSGAVMPVGGLKDKLETARQNGIRTVILPLASLRELQAQQGGLRDLSQDGPELVGVERLEDAIRIAFEDVEGPAAGAGAAEPRTAAAVVQEGNVTVEGTKKKACDDPTSSSMAQHLGREGQGAWLVSPSRLPMDEGVYWGAAQSMTWRIQDGKLVSLPVEVEVVLQPGTAMFTPLDHRSTIGMLDTHNARGWLSHHQQEVRPRKGEGFLLPDLANKFENLDVMTKVYPAGELTEQHLGAAVAVAMVSAVTGYRYNKKACIVGAMTVDGRLLPMASVNELDVVLMLGSGVEVVVISEGNFTEVATLRAKYAHVGSTTRFVGVKTLLEALPLLLLDYQPPSSLDQVASLKASVPSAPLSESVAHEPQARKRPREESEEQPDAGKRSREEEGGQGGSPGGAAAMMEM